MPGQSESGRTPACALIGANLGSRSDVPRGASAECANDLAAAALAALRAGDPPGALRALEARLAGATGALDGRDETAHWRLHSLALAHDVVADAMLAERRLAEALTVMRNGLELRRSLAELPDPGGLFHDTIDVRVEVAANHLAIGHALRRAGRLPEALEAMRAGIAIYRERAEAEVDPCALDSVADYLEEAGRTAQEVPDVAAARALFIECLDLRARAVALAPDDAVLARAFVEACVWQAPLLGKASVPWLDQARRMIEAHASDGAPLPGAQRLLRMVDTAGAPTDQA